MQPTPHIKETNKSNIAKTVLMPGDPLRAQFIAETFLTDVKLFNDVRNMYGYTGKYKGVEVSVMGSGMGMPSIGIYSYELYAFYDVERIIRIGSCGAYTEQLNLFDILLVTDAWSESSYAKTMYGYEGDALAGSEAISKNIRLSAENNNFKLVEGRIHSSDVFYRKNFDDYKTIFEKHNCLAVEMESFALFANAAFLGKEAACLLTVSDHLVKHQATTSEERQLNFSEMMQVALDAAIL